MQKERKKAMNSHVGEVASDQFGSMITVRELEAILKDLVIEKNGRRPLLQLIDPNSSRYLSDLASLNLSVPSLCSTDKSEKSSQTKDSDGRESDKKVAVGASDGILCPSLSEKLRELYEAIASVAAKPKPQEPEKNSEHILEDFHSSRTIRKLVLDCPAFASLLYKEALSGKCRLKIPETKITE